MLRNAACVCVGVAVDMESFVDYESVAPLTTFSSRGQRCQHHHRHHHCGQRQRHHHHHHTLTFCDSASAFVEVCLCSGNVVWCGVVFGVLCVECGV